MRNLILMLVMLLGSYSNAQTYTHPTTNVDYTIVSGDNSFTNDVNGLADGSFSWSWTQPVSDISATQIFFDPAGNPEHRSDYVVSLTRNGQSGNVTVTVTSTTSVGQYRWGTATAPTSSVDHSDINRAIADARASLSVGESAYIWTTATTSYHATLGQTELLVRAPDGNGGNVVGGSAAPTRGQEIQYDEPDVWGPWVYSRSEVTDANWNSSEADFGTSEGPTVVVSRSRTRMNRGTVREALVGDGFQEFLFTNTNPGALTIPADLMDVYNAFIATETITITTASSFIIRGISVSPSFACVYPGNVYDASLGLCYGLVQDNGFTVEGIFGQQRVIEILTCHFANLDNGTNNTCN